MTFLAVDNIIVTTEPGYAVGWGTLSLVNAGLAQAKGRSGLAWWIVSLLIGPLATLLIVVLEPVAPTAGRRNS